MSTDNRALMRRWFEEVWNQRREATIHELLHPEGVVHGLPQPVRGPAGFIPFWKEFTAAIPDARVVVDEAIAEGNLVAARCTVSGRHSGQGLGNAPTNAQITFTGMCFARLKDGKFIEAWNNFDFLLLYQQLGMVARNL